MLEYARWLERNAWRIVFAFAVLVAAAGALAASLKLEDDLAELLPAGSRSLEDLHRVMARVGGANLTVAIQSPDLKQNERFADDLVARLRERMAGDIRFVDYNVRAMVDFYGKNALLYTELADLEQVERDLRAEIDERELRANPLYVDVDDQPAAPAPTRSRWEQVEDRLRRVEPEANPYPDAYCASEDGQLLAIFIRPSRAGTAHGTRAFTDKVRTVIDELAPHRYHPQMRVDFTGELETGLQEYESVKRDIASTALLC